MQWFKFISIICAVLLGGAVFAEVNLNTASEEQLMDELINIGPSKAAEIVRYREKYGPFKSVDELVGVRGIGMSTLEKNRHLLTVEEDGVDDQSQKKNFRPHKSEKMIGSDVKGELRGTVKKDMPH